MKGRHPDPWQLMGSGHGLRICGGMWCMWRREGRIRAPQVFPNHPTEIANDSSYGRRQKPAYGSLFGARRSSHLLLPYSNVIHGCQRSVPPAVCLVVVRRAAVVRPEARRQGARLRRRTINRRCGSRPRVVHRACGAVFRPVLHRVLHSVLQLRESPVHIRGEWPTAQQL